MRRTSLCCAMYYIYILRCADETLYTGITTDVARRMKEHFGKEKRAARYTRWHTAKKLEAVWQCTTRQQASRLEYRVKQLSKARKEQLVAENNVEEQLGQWLDANAYERMELTAYQEFAQKPCE